MDKKSEIHNMFKRSSGTLWDFFASIRLSVVILLSLAATSIIGTVIPQNQHPHLYEEAYGKILYTIFDLLALFDMYHSWWFRLLLCMLSINIFVCSIKRLRSTWKVIFPKSPSYNLPRFQKAKGRQEWTTKDTAEEIIHKIHSHIIKQFSAVQQQETDNGMAIFAEKGRWTRLGVYAVHTSILLLILGGLVGSFFGFEGYVEVPEGQVVSSFRLRDQETPMNLDFSILCNDFQMTLYDSGMPKEYQSDLSILKDGKEVFRKVIEVNDPLRFEGINIFQSYYGRIPGKNLTVTFTESASGMEYHKEASIGVPVNLPGNKGSLIIEDFKKSFPFRGMQMENVFIGRLIPESGDPRLIMVPVDFPRFDRMRGGEFVISVSDMNFIDFTGLQITRDPGVPIVYTSFILMIIGCYVTFFMFHQKFCVEIINRPGTTRIIVSGISERNRPGIQIKTKRLAECLKRLK